MRLAAHVSIKPDDLPGGIDARDRCGRRAREISRRKRWVVFLGGDTQRQRHNRANRQFHNRLAARA
jgi:hypothetical protein